MTENETTITIPRRWIVGFCVAGAVVGFGAAFAVGPFVEWLLSLAGDAPGPLRIAARLPLVGRSPSSRSWARVWGIGSPVSGGKM